MELKINIGYQELLELIKQLPSCQIKKLKSDISLLLPDNDKHLRVSDFQKFIINGPVMDDDQYNDFIAARKQFNAWRTN